MGSLFSSEETLSSKMITDECPVCNLKNKCKFAGSADAICSNHVDFALILLINI